MSRNGSGTYNLPSGNPVVTGTTISSTWANSTLSDIANALTGSIASDGQTPVTGNLNMGANKITSMADGSSSTDAATYGQLVSAVALAIPSGLISMWSGSIASIPTGWLLCDGTNSTPDLRDRFVVGAGSTYSVNATGGSANAITVAHTHTASTASAGSHQHFIGNTDVVSSSFNAISPTNYLAKTADSGSSGVAYGEYALAGTSTTATVGLTSSAGSHTHTVTVDSTGSSGTNANLPPYYALAYIMKA